MITLPSEINRAIERCEKGESTCFTISLKELQYAAEFAKSHGNPERKTIMVEVVSGSIGNVVKVISLKDGRTREITDYDSW